jgi:hypothetical protein
MSAQVTKTEQSRPMFSIAEVLLMNQLRLLWEQHVAWTRMTIISIVNTLPDEELTTKRLLRNPRDFQRALEPFYGILLAAEFADLFTSHLTIAAELVHAAKAGEDEAAADAERRWYENAFEFSVFLGRINPFWFPDTWRFMLFEHLALTKSEAVNMLSSNFQQEIELYDKIEDQALLMADEMSFGIIHQYPELF